MPSLTPTPTPTPTPSPTPAPASQCTSGATFRGGGRANNEYRMVCDTVCGATRLLERTTQVNFTSCVKACDFDKPFGDDDSSFTTVVVNFFKAIGACEWYAYDGPASTPNTDANCALIVDEFAL
ncbi:hypothetical protein CC86DRAFT_368385 [Ophiobolus disseminans]|uniref:Uncharacterized protein n=1 Tax=Ophiobolus disseminans TaxID=1469910 RepID=A0A6A7A9K8_9PLEO|nr:hypothetical protein CC86DRAFT_368385 [Ophiobolus disseminans]